MNYKVLYRKYRPNTFENIIGQDYIITTLKNSIINQSIAHAYIFSGPRGTGKTSTAKVFAKAINCLNNDTGSPCGNCEFCKNFSENPDIIEIDAASNNGVDEIRNLIDNIKLTPSNGKFKVYIIDEVHMLTTSAFNALLLTLEEPPKHVVFILATTNIESVPITILSRCQRFDFQKIKIKDIVNCLEKICKEENIHYEDGVLEEIAYLSEGGMRDALSLLDQLSKNTDNISLELVENQIKIVSQSTIEELFQNIESNDIDNVIKEIDNFRNNAINYKYLVKKIIEYLSKKIIYVKKNIEVKRLSYLDYKNIIIELADTLNKININVDAYTILEIILLNYIDVKRSDNKKTITTPAKLQEKEEKNNINIDNPKEMELKDYNNLIDIRINNCFVNATKNDLENLKSLITNFLSSSYIDGKIKSILLDATLVTASPFIGVFCVEDNYASKIANNLVDLLENEFKNFNKNDIKFIFASKDKWEVEKQKYIENLKNNVKYTYIKEEFNNSDEILNDVFDITKVEII